MRRKRVPPRTKLKENAIAELAARRLRGESLDKIADEIVLISDAITKLRKTKLTEDTMLLLIQDAIGTSAQTKYKPVGIKVIKAVLDGIENLKTKHLRDDSTPTNKIR